MDANRLIGMLTRLVIRSAANAAVTLASRGGKPTETMTDAERQQSKAAKDTVKRFRQTTRLGRRFFR